MARPLKTDEDKRSAHLPPPRVTEAERALIAEKADEAGLSVSAFVRKACLEAIVLARPAVVELRLVRELNAIGNNLNQLTRLSHIHEECDPEKLQDMLVRLDALLVEIGA